MIKSNNSVKAIISFLGFSMERGKRIKVENGEFHLPEPIIQHIQSFMSGKQAAQTSILAKSWHSAWSTRPSLDFFANRRTLGSFEKTMQRYEELNLNIESFRLCIDCCQKQFDFANKSIVKAMRMGAAVLDFKLLAQNDFFVLPKEVFGSETLTRLSVANCKIDLGPEPKVRFRLKSLILSSVYTEGDIIWVIVSNCPLIENLELSKCKCLFDSDNVARRSTKMLVLKLGRAFDSPTNPYRFPKLKSLLLEKVVIGTWIFDGFSSRFPCLKDLALHNCVGYKEIEICSRSLESISFSQASTLRATLDIPNVRKFKFSGSFVPSLSFKTTAPSQWESDISIACTHFRHCLNSSWFSKLNKFLTEFSPSRISLLLTISSHKSSETLFKGLSKRPAVENLKLSVDSPSGVCSDFLDGLFSSCRPKLITLLWVPKWSPFRGEANNDFVKIICKTLIKEVSEGCFVPNSSNKCGLRDLEEVTVESSEVNREEWRPICWNTYLDASNRDEWRPLCWNTLLDASPSSGDARKIRFQLRWQVKH